MEKQVTKGKLDPITKPGSLDRTTGKPKTSVNKKSDYSYNIDKGNTPRKGGKSEKSHFDVNYPNKTKPKPLKKKLDTK